MSTHQESWIGESRRILQRSAVNFFQVRASRYWFDFLLSVVIAYTAGSVYLMAPLFSAAQLVAFPITVFWLYRLSSLVHEVAHLPHKEMQTFKVAWNLVVGVMILSPSPFFTRHHRDHHTRRMYGTPEDPEYIANVVRPGSWLSWIGYGLLVAVFPLVVFVRFLLAPLTFVHPRLREWVLMRASSLTMNWHYQRRLNAFDRWAITATELLCCVRAWVIPLGVILGLATWERLPLLYLLAFSTLALNQLRLMADHHLESDGGQLNLSDHILDSCNYTGKDPMTWLLFPFSIRYHALHHLFPTLPYHNLSAAHRYLMHHVAADSPYRSLDQGSWWHVAREVFRGTNTPQRGGARPPVSTSADSAQRRVA